MGAWRGSSTEGRQPAQRRGRNPWRVGEGFKSSEGLSWCRELLDGYDLGSLSRLTVRDGSGRKVTPGVWGTCYYPNPQRGIPNYRITCSVKGPFPASVRTRKSPLYAREDGTYPPVPEGLVPGQGFVSRRGGKVRRWVRLYGKTRLATPDEAVVWIVAHEAFHFLRRTRQVPGRNPEIDADRFSDDALKHFRYGRGPSRFRSLQEPRAEKPKPRRAS